MYIYHGKITKVYELEGRFYYVVVTALGSWVLPEAAVYQRYKQIDLEENIRVAPVLSLAKEEEVHE